jgi:hypothetical protein
MGKGKWQKCVFYTFKAFLPTLAIGMILLPLIGMKKKPV